MRIGTLLGIAVGLSACAESPIAPSKVIEQPPALSAVTSSSRLTTSFNRTLWISCANDGAGESVALAGEIEIHSHSTEDANGGVHLSTHVRPSHVVGIGLSTGAIYRGTGGTFEAEGDAAGGYPATYSFVNNFRIIGQGPGNNLTMHMTVHQTMNANGELTADVDLTNSDCK
jgi:hypothetical protein